MDINFLPVAECDYDLLSFFFFHSQIGGIEVCSCLNCLYIFGNAVNGFFALRPLCWNKKRLEIAVAPAISSFCEI